MKSTNTRKNVFFQLYNFLSSAAEGIQTVIILWTIYHQTNSPFLVSLVIVASYLPSAILGFFFLGMADTSSPKKHLLITNTMITFISVIVYFIFNTHGINLLTLSMFYFSQAVLSVVKMFNKTSQNRILRTVFTKKEAVKALQLTSASIQTAQVCGALLGGWAISFGYTMPGLLLTCFIYTINIFFSFSFENNELQQRSDFLVRNKVKNEKLRFSSIIALFWNKNFLIPLIFTVPSSGALQFINTSLPFLSSLFTHSSNVYPIFNFILHTSVIVSGIVATLNYLSVKTSLHYCLFISGFSILLILIFRNNIFLVYIFLFITLFFISSHIISIKVLTNQMPDMEHIGKFTMIRNSVASAVKIVFSLTSSILISFYSLQTTYILLVVILFFFNCIWFLFFINDNEFLGNFKN